MKSISFLKVILLAACIIILVGFGGVSQASEKMTLYLIIAHWNPAVRDAFEDIIIPKFEENHPGVKVEMKYTSFARYMEEITTAFVGGTSPDVFQGGGVWAPRMAHNKWAVPLDDFIAESPEFNWEDFFPVCRDDVSIGGKIVAIPYNTMPLCFLYRESFLKEAGVKVPDTWTDLREAAVKLTIRDASGEFVRAGWNFFTEGSRDYRIHQAFWPFLYQSGGSILNEEETECALSEPEAVEALKFVDTLINELEVCPKPAGMELVGGTHPIVIGKAAMKTRGLSMILEQMKRYNPENYEDLKAKLPLIGKKRATHVFVNKYFISSQSKHPEMAWELLKFLTSPEQLGLYNEVYATFPPRASLIKMEYIQKDPSLKVFMRTGEYGICYPKKHYVYEMFDPVNHAVEMALERRISQEQALKIAADRINQVIKREER